MGPKEITKDIYLVGGADITDSSDCLVYLINMGEMVLIDAGAGRSVEGIVVNIRKLGLDPEKHFNDNYSLTATLTISAAPGSFATALVRASSCTSSTPTLLNGATTG